MILVCKRSSLSCSLSLAAVLSLTMPSFAKDHKPTNPVPVSLADIVQRVNPSVVRIVFSYSFQSSDLPSPENENPTVEVMKGESSGTGFMVDSNGRIATANHIVDVNYIQGELLKSLANAKKQMILGSLRTIDLTVVVPMTGGQVGVRDDHFYNVNAGYRATVYRQDQMSDVAILDCSQNLTKPTHSGIGVSNKVGDQHIDVMRPLPKFRTDSPRSGDSILTSGFPSAGGDAIPGITTTSGMISNPIYEDRSRNQFLYLAAMQVNHGNSGGPVFQSTDGKVIGFVDLYLNAQDGENSGLTAIVPIGQVLQLLPPNGTLAARADPSKR